MLNYNEELDKLRSKVLRYALYKKRTEKEIRTKFANENQDYLDEIIEFMIEDNYINDSEYIEAYFYESSILRNQSIKEITFKLIEKGLNRNDIDKYIQANSEDLQEYEINSAIVLLDKRSDKEADKNISYLLNKGFSMDNIRLAISRLEDK